MLHPIHRLLGARSGGGPIPAENYVIVAHGEAREVRSDRAEVVEKGVREAVVAGSAIL